MDDTWWRKPEDLDEDQKALINGLAVDEDHLITGPPGSGKTNLLILRASYLHLLGRHNIAIVTFNRILKEFLFSGVGHYDFSGDKIGTFIKWGIDVLAEHGENLEHEDCDFEKHKERVSESLEDLLSNASNISKFDYIFLDEAQDYTDREVDIFRSFSRRIFAVGDSGQQIYDNKGGLRRLREFCTAAKPLRYHYRNGRKICRVADALRGRLNSPDGLESSSQYDEIANPSSVEALASDNIEAQAQEIVDRLKRQLLAYPDERLGVACPRHAELGIVWEAIEDSELAENAQLQRIQEGYSQLDPNRQICVSTLHGTKGMEFRALHIAGTEHINKFRARQKNLIYTGITRAKTSLTVHHTRSLPGYLENAIAAIDVTPDMPDLSDLFKGGK